MTEMDLPTHRDPCRNCGLWGHEHDKTKVFSENGRWHWEYHCPDEPSVDSIFERLQERVGRRVAEFVVDAPEDEQEAPGGGES